MYYPCGENKGADQLCSYCTADLRLCFAYAKDVLLVEATAPTNKVMLNHLYQYVLFDFRIWSRSDFPVRIGKTFV